MKPIPVIPEARSALPDPVPDPGSPLRSGRDDTNIETLSWSSTRNPNPPGALTSAIPFRTRAAVGALETQISEKGPIANAM